MTPNLKGFDHMHVYVTHRELSEKWYADVMGFKRIDALISWAANGGPLTLTDPTDTIHLALFERENGIGATVVAFGANAEEFLQWKAHLEAKGLTQRIADHDMAFSMYFHDPDKNMYEITCYDHALVRKALT